MGDAELFEIVVKGPGPFGFRLYGGEGDPLIVAKLRSRSKAHDAGLREGDVVLGINGQSCETISHGVAMALLESADDTLHLHLYRGSATKDSLSAAFQSLTSQLRPVAPGTVPPNRSIFTIHPEPEAAAQPPADHHQPPPAQPPAHPHESASFSRQQEVTSLGANATQTITTDTETQDLGGVTLTKVTRQVVLETTTGGSGATWTQEPATRDDGDATNVQRAATFHVPKISAQPLRWQPGSGSSAEDRERAVDRILINRPVTVDVSPIGGGGGGREGGEQSRVRAYAKVDGPREAQTTFKVPKTSAKPWIWQPSYVPDLPVREASPTLAFQILEASGAPPSSHENHVNREEESGRRGGRGGGRGGGGRSSDDPELSPDLIRALTTEPEDDWAAIMRRKKIFADSSFYDDPAQKYPTIEEQIKMARKVALSLSAPDNVTARGQRMFMKCKEKANQSTSDSVSLEGLYTHTLPRKGPGSGGQPRPKGTSTPEVGEPPSTTSRDLYYNPTPWKTPVTTKKVERVTLDLRTKQVTVGGAGGGSYGPPPEDTHVSFTKTRAQFERGIRQNQTVQPPHYDRSGRKVHGGAPGGGSLAPQALHGLNDLKGMRGKGARLFAQRKAKLAEEEEEAEQRAAEHGGWQSEGETGLVRERSEERPGYDYPDPMDQASARRLQELISISKAYLAPWESTAGGQQHQQHQQQQSGKGSATTEDHSLPIVRSIASEQKTSGGSLPSFLGKASGGGYRPVRFQLQSDLYASHAGVSEF